MLQQFANKLSFIVYVIILFGTIVQTGVGVLQGINERLDQWRIEVHGKPFKPRFHAVVAAATVLTSMLLANLGIVTLVAKGYGMMAWVALGVYVAPLLIMGAGRLWREKMSRTQLE